MDNNHRNRVEDGRGLSNRRAEGIDQREQREAEERRRLSRKHYQERVR